MPSCNTYCLTWVSLTLDVGYLFTAAPAKRSHCSLPWMTGISSLTAPPDLERGVAPFGPPVPVQLPLLGSDQNHPQLEEMKQSKIVVLEALEIAEKRREAKGKGEKERYTHLNVEFQRIARRDKKALSELV